MKMTLQYGKIHPHNKKVPATPTKGGVLVSKSYPFTMKLGIFYDVIRHLLQSNIQCLDLQ